MANGFNHQCGKRFQPRANDFNQASSFFAATAESRLLLDFYLLIFSSSHLQWIFLQTIFLGQGNITQLCKFPNVLWVISRVQCSSKYHFVCLYNGHLLRPGSHHQSLLQFRIFPAHKMFNLKLNIFLLYLEMFLLDGWGLTEVKFKQIRYCLGFILSTGT